MSDVNTLPEPPEPPEHLPSEPHHPLQGGQHQLSNPLLSGALTAVLPLAQDPPTVSGRVPMERRLSHSHIESAMSLRASGNMSSSGTGGNRSVPIMAFGPEAAANGTPAIGGDSVAQ